MAAPNTFGNPVRGKVGPPGRPDPASRFVITRRFGDASMPQYGNHDGLDIDNGGAPGDDILAMEAGRVYQAFYDANSGGAGIIRIDHGNGWTTGYAHMDRLYVKAGATVTKGQRIGSLDSTGWVTGPHLHYDTTQANVRKNPEPYLNRDYPDPVPVPTPGGWPAMIFKPVKQEWNTKAGTPSGRFYTEGPGVGAPKYFTTVTRVTSIASSADGKWFELLYGAEILWMERANLNPISGTRDPASGFGPPTKTPNKAADAVRDAGVAALNTAAKKWGA